MHKSEWFHDDEWVILDSGADLSLLPQRLRSRGKPIDVPNLQVSDAQGGSLPIRDMRRVVLSTEWSDLSGVMIQEDFAVTNVKSILLSLGKLLKKGWRLEKINPADANNSNLVEIMEFLCSIEGTVWRSGAKSAKSKLRTKKQKFVRSLSSYLRMLIRLNQKNGQ